MISVRVLTSIFFIISAAADFNGDNYLDVVLHDNNNVFIMLGDGTGSFAPAQKTPATATSGGWPDLVVDIAGADFNGDDRPDIVAIHGDSNYIWVLLNKGDGSFAAPRKINTDTEDAGVVAADVNGDGHPDFITIGNFPDQILSVFLNDGQGNFAAPQKYNSNSDGYFSRYFQVADFNGDGQVDIALPNDRSISIMIGDGTGAFAAPQTFPIGADFFNITVADFNGDGKTDLATANYYDHSVSILLNTSSLPPVTSAWNLRFGGTGTDRFTTVIKTDDGGYLAGGYSNSGVSGDKSQPSRGGADYWIIKTDKNGAKLWDKTYGGPAADYLNRIIPTRDGGYLLAGSSISGSGGDKTEVSRGSQNYWIVKISSNGTQQWDKTYGGSGFDDLSKVNQLANGDYILAGTSNSPISGAKSQASRGGQDYWVIRVDNTGNKIWDYRYGGGADDYLASFTKTTDGGFLLAGSSASGKSGDKSQSSKGGRDYWLVRIDAAGTKLWDQAYGGRGEDELYSIGITPAGDFFVAGRSTSGQSGDKTQASRGESDYWLLQLNGQGEKRWDQSYGGSGQESLRSVIQAPDGGYVLAGTSDSPVSGDQTQASRGGADYWLVKTDAQGNKQYDQRLGGAGAEEFRFIQRTDDGGYLLGGRSDSGISGDRTQPSQGGTDYWLVKIAPTLAAAVPATARQNRPQSETSVGLKLNQAAYPNPFSEQVTASFTLPQSQPVTVKVYNSQGQEVTTLYQGEAQAHKAYTVEWQPNADQPAGTYILRFRPAVGQATYQRVLLTR